MNEFLTQHLNATELGLLALGVGVLLGLLINYLRAVHKSRVHNAQLTSVQQDPVLHDAAVLPAEFAPQQAPGAALQDKQPSAALAGHVPETDRRKLPLDPLIDSIATIHLGNPASGHLALAAMPPSRRVGNKPMALEALNTVTQQWEFPVATSSYSSFQFGIQLANRLGALNEVEFSEFATKVQLFAEQVNGVAEFSDMLEEVARARELDQFASAHDAQLVLRIQARTVAWSPAFVHAKAVSLGFSPGHIPGKMVYWAKEQAAQVPMLTLSWDMQAALSQDETVTIASVDLGLEFGHVGREHQPFAQMCSLAKTMAQGVDGLIVDDGGHVLGEASFAQIAADLDRLYDTLEMRGLQAGSPQARRLFS
jgi:ZipA, C-terminal FtsZ-binding domain